jgi:hypothetical protein
MPSDAAKGHHSSVNLYSGKISDRLSEGIHKPLGQRFCGTGDEVVFRTCI